MKVHVVSSLPLGSLTVIVIGCVPAVNKPGFTLLKTVRAVLQFENAAQLLSVTVGCVHVTSLLVSDWRRV